MTTPAAAPAPTPKNELAVLGLSVIGGLFIGSWAYSHMFVEGMEEAERKKMLLYVGAAGIVGAAAWIFDLDRKYWDVEAAASWADEAITKATSP